LGVVTELTQPVHARVEPLLAVVVASAAIRFEQVASAVSQGHAAVATVERDRADQALVSEVLKAVVAAIGSLVPRIKIALGDGAERPNRRKHPAVVAVQLVQAFAVEDQLSLESAWQVQIAEQGITRIVDALA